MAKKTYETPVADLLVFDYRNTVVASLTEEEEGDGFDASHCFNGRNQGQCLGNNWKKCGGTANPGNCHS